MVQNVCETMTNDNLAEEMLCIRKREHALHTFAAIHLQKNYLLMRQTPRTESLLPFIPADRL